MTLDPTKMATFTAEMMDKLEAMHGGGLNEMELGEIMIVVELRGEDDDGHPATAVQFACTDPRYWIHHGLLDAAKEQVA